jgi:hypothetical protein
VSKKEKANKNNKHIQDVGKLEELGKMRTSRNSAMTFSTPWLGPKRVAFVPLFRSNAAPPDQIPPDWEMSCYVGWSMTLVLRPMVQTVHCANDCAPPPRAEQTSTR